MCMTAIAKPADVIGQERQVGREQPRLVKQKTMSTTKSKRAAINADARAAQAFEDLDLRTMCRIPTITMSWPLK